MVVLIHSFGIILSDISSSRDQADCNPVTVIITSATSFKPVITKVTTKVTNSARTYYSRCNQNRVVTDMLTQSYNPIIEDGRNNFVIQNQSECKQD